MKAQQIGANPQRSPSDLTRTQWKKLKRRLPQAQPGGRPRSVTRREVLNGVFYIARGGGAWRRLPQDLPPGSTCYDSCRTWRNDGTWAKVNDALGTRVRHPATRKESPSLGLRDSQSVPTAEPGGPRGQDASPKVKGRPRHLVVDPRGMLVTAVVHSAGLQDRDGAQRVLKERVNQFPRLQKILADGIDHGGMAEGAQEGGGGILDLVVRPAGPTTFEVLPGRWIVERTCAGLGRYRRLSKEYEGTEASSESWIYVAMTHLMLRRLESA